MYVVCRNTTPRRRLGSPSATPIEMSDGRPVYIKNAVMFGEEWVRKGFLYLIHIDNTRETGVIAWKYKMRDAGVQNIGGGYKRSPRLSAILYLGTASAHTV